LKMGTSTSAIKAFRASLSSLEKPSWLFWSPLQDSESFNRQKHSASTRNTKSMGIINTSWHIAWSFGSAEKHDLFQLSSFLLHLLLVWYSSIAFYTSEFSNRSTLNLLTNRNYYILSTLLMSITFSKKNTFLFFSLENSFRSDNINNSFGVPISRYFLDIFFIKIYYNYCYLT